MKYGPVGVIFETVDTLIGKTLLSLAVLFVAANIGVSLAAKEFFFSFDIFGYVFLAMVAPFVSLICAALTLTQLVLLFVYIRGEQRHWLLIPIFILGAAHTYALHHFA